MKLLRFSLIFLVLFFAAPNFTSAATLQEIQRIQLIAEIKQKILTLQIQLIQLQIQEALSIEAPPALTQEQAAAKVLPASVSITSTRLVPQLQSFGLTIQQQISSGSGFLATGDGFVITNRHVVHDSEALYTVSLTSGSQHGAKVVYRDAVQDLAILKISGAGYPFAMLGDSNLVTVGQPVIAIGNAFGTNPNTVTSGTITGLNQSIFAEDERGNSEFLTGVIRTNAQIHPGSSGGPLVDLQGNVIGVGVAMVQGSESISFAIPSLEVRKVLNAMGL